MGQDAGVAVTATVRRWQLTETLRGLREQSGMTIDQVVEKLSEQGGKWSRSKLSRIENREQGVKSFDVERLLDAYGVDDDDVREWVLSLAERAGERGYWLAIRKDLPEDFHELLNVEAALLARRQLETMIVPGLLQTPDYTRALINGANPGMAHEVVERRVLARAARQRVLTRPSPVRYHVILDETVLERPIGTSPTMVGQLSRLTDAATQEHITIQVLPKSAGATPAVNGSFSILTLPDPIPDVGYAEGPGGAVYIEDRAEVRTCIERWGILTERALTVAESLEAIKAAGKTYE
ncbi:helix-turn-helix domain-containing protein [Actinokineospora xionganensis]|uniref:Helix-turn-helix domain-containing protein n=1 Tax=Actinokineospora xionganensis TaxID=2684470 RepID=A0ABR7L608_9PSEU|nr:helix-turn-helix transcriptional regulator [Actinokineospora xionganensis]MBC6448074.1 helix-turn-helix domain-containing protein [Actinokineospora xionganensis]